MEAIKKIKNPKSLITGNYFNPESIIIAFPNFRYKNCFGCFFFMRNITISEDMWFLALSVDGASLLLYFSMLTKLSYGNFWTVFWWKLIHIETGRKMSFGLNLSNICLDYATSYSSQWLLLSIKYCFKRKTWLNKNKELREVNHKGKRLI